MNSYFKWQMFHPPVLNISDETTSVKYYAACSLESRYQLCLQNIY